MNAEFLIRVGAPTEFSREYGRANFAVYKRTRGTVVSYIIAKDLGWEDKNGGEARIPTSVLKAFDSRSEAILALDGYADAPKDIPLLKPPKTAIEACRKAYRPKCPKVGPGQRDLFIP
jgi:hypothetical protein